MTPEIKAKELVEKFMPYADSPFQSIKERNAKQCSIIAVDEIFNFMAMDDDFNKDCHMANTHWPQYWQQVKNEINKL